MPQPQATVLELGQRAVFRARRKAGQAGGAVGFERGGEDGRRRAGHAVLQARLAAEYVRASAARSFPSRWRSGNSRPASGARRAVRRRQAGSAGASCAASCATGQGRRRGCRITSLPAACRARPRPRRGCRCAGWRDSFQRSACTVRPHRAHALPARNSRSADWPRRSSQSSRPCRSRFRESSGCRDRTRHSGR